MVGYDGIAGYVNLMDGNMLLITCMALFVLFGRQLTE